MRGGSGAGDRGRPDAVASAYPASPTIDDMSAGAPQDQDPVVRYVSSVGWRFARTMPQWPHWYVMKHWNPGRESEFMELVRRVFEEGHDEPWGDGPLRRIVRYYHLGEHKYWVMDPRIEETDLVNRARLDGRGPEDERGA